MDYNKHKNNAMNMFLSGMLGFILIGFVELVWLVHVMMGLSMLFLLIGLFECIAYEDEQLQKFYE